MKSLNVKKIASAAAGGALLAAAFAGAATTVDEGSLGNYNFFTNGEPNVKIVVGSQAQIWDGVAAANVAAMIGNLAYSEKDVTAMGGSGATPAPADGTVADKNVELSVTSPAGSTGQSGTATIDTQLYDYLDNDVKTATTNRDDDASSVLIGDGISTGGFYMSNTLYPDVVYKGKLANLGSYSVTEEEGFYVTGQSYYDFTEDAYVGDRVKMAYIINFTDALPYHIDIVNGSTAGRPSNDDKITENRNIKMKFLGRDFVVTDFENGTSGTNPSISLGESAVFKQMKAGESVKLGNRELKLVSISPIATTGNEPFASFEILDAEGVRLDFFTMSKSTSDYNKNGLILDVRDVFVGGGDSSYTEIAVYSSAITLQDGNKLIFQGDDATTRLNQDAGWSASLVFNELNVGSQVQKTLKQIKLSGPTSTRIKVGKSFNLIEKPVAKSLTFLGPVAGDSDMLTIKAIGRQTMERFTNTTGDPNPTGTNVDINVTEIKSAYASAFLVGGKTYDTVWVDKYNGRFLVKDTTGSQTNYTSPTDVADDTMDYYYPATTAASAFQIYSTVAKPAPLNVSAHGLSAGTATFNSSGTTGYFVTYNTSSGSVSVAGYSTFAHNGGALAGGALLSWIAVPGATQYTIYAQNATNTYLIGSTTGATFTTTAFQPITVGATAPAYNRTGSTMRLRIYEPVIDNTASLNGYWNIDMFPNGDANDANYLFNRTLSTSTLTTQYVTSTSAGTSISNFPQSTSLSTEQGYVSPGGSVLKTLGLSEVSLTYAKRLVKARWQFGAPSNVNITEGGEIVSTTTLVEGDEYSLGGGYKVKVSAIGGTAVCSGSGSGSGTCDPARAAVVTPLNTASDKLVILDSEAGSTAQLIVVGGPMVNSVARGTDGVDAVTNAPGSSVVKVFGSKVVVAGYTAQDTTDAANALIGWLAQNRDTVRGV